MNVFQLSYDARLQDWYKLRNQIKDSDILQKCIEVDNWWQHAPLVNHYLHPHDMDAWPDPWELLVDNTYCTIARALGMCYTLLLLEVKDIQLVEARNDVGEDAVLVLVDNAKYVLNYWPDTVISNNLSDFSITNQIDFTKITKKLGNI
jgi:hypothetical protein